MSALSKFGGSILNPLLKGTSPEKYSPATLATAGDRSTTISIPPKDIIAARDSIYSTILYAMGPSMYITHTRNIATSAQNRVCPAASHPAGKFVSFARAVAPPETYPPTHKRMIKDTMNVNHPYIL